MTHVFHSRFSNLSAKMENSLGSAIEKIKREEQNKEVKLKAKRELDAAKAAADRSFRDIVTQIKKLQQEKADLIRRTDELRAQATIQKIRCDALVEQLSSSNKELGALKTKSEQRTLELQELRSSYCKAVQDVSDECDVWALLTKPSTEPLPRAAVKKSTDSEVNELTVMNERRLQNARERHDRALADRERLKAEPETGEEFIRKFVSRYKSNKFFSTQKNQVEIDENAPIKFSTSPAAQKTIRPVVRKVNIDSMPWYQPYSVIASITVFLLYFCVLREENDVDVEFTKTLYERIKGLEKEQLLQSYKFNKEQGKSVEEIEARLKELEEQEGKVVA